MAYDGLSAAHRWLHRLRPSAAALRAKLNAAGLLVAALAGGALLRFIHLGAREMSADEGASWAAAAAPSVGDVLRLQERLNPGKLALHELALHWWIGLFGSTEAALRSLSAALGTVAILEIFWVAREVLLVGDDTQRATSRTSLAPIAALSALLFAISLATIKYSREARMYPVLLLMVLAQVGFLLRALRLGGALNYAGCALFTALAIASHFTATFVVATEGLWLLSDAVAARFSMNAAKPAGGSLPWGPLCAMAAGVVALLPLMGHAIGASTTALGQGALDWIKPPAPWEPIAFFNRATGSFAFPVLAALAIWGGWRGWTLARGAVSFALAWMWGPILMLMAISWLVRPLLVERYALSSFVPFFLLVAMGLYWCRPAALRTLLAIVVIVLSLGHIRTYERKPHDAQWREAAHLALAVAGAGTIAVAPPFAADVVRYYLPAAAQDRVKGIGCRSCTASAAVLVMSDQGVSQSERVVLQAAFPAAVSRQRGVEVLGHGAPRGE